MTGTHQPPFTYIKESGKLRCFLGGEEQVPGLSTTPTPTPGSTALLVCPLPVVLLGLLLRPTCV